jgi:hypothetical protein
MPVDDAESCTFRFALAVEAPKKFKYSVSNGLANCDFPMRLRTGFPVEEE